MSHLNLIKFLFNLYFSKFLNFISTAITFDPKSINASISEPTCPLAPVTIAVFFQY